MVPIYVASGSPGRTKSGECSIGCSRRRRSPGVVEPVVDLQFDMRDVFPPTHWAVRGEPPAFDTPDEDVYLDGRNVVLLSKASRLHGARRIPVVTARAAGWQSVSRCDAGLLRGHGARAVARARRRRSRSRRRLRRCTSRTSIKKGIELGVPLELTLSCMQPRRRPALRAMQQVPRAPRCVQGGGNRGSDGIPRSAPVR